MLSVRTVFVLAAIAILGLSACSGAEAPQSPPEMTPPPAVAETGFVTATVTADFDMSVTELRAYMTENSIVDYMEETGEIAKPVGQDILEGSWPEVGAVRRIELSDGHYVIERIVLNEPEKFRYQIWVLTNASGRAVEQIVGEQRWIATGPNTSRFEWDYHIVPRYFFLRPIVARIRTNSIQPFLQGALDRMAADVPAPPSPAS